MPKISVIIPTYNRANTLPKTINSVLNQTYQDFEIIIVDDGSDDNIKDIITKIQKKDNRIKYFFQEHFGSPSKPLNFGIKNSLGEYITFLGSDDELSPIYLEKLLNLLESSEKNVDITSCNVLIIDDKGKVLREISKPKNTNNEHIIRTSLTHNYIFGNIFVKREIFNKVGFFDENIKIREDFDMWIRLAKMNLNFEFIYKPLYLVNIHKKQISANIHSLERIYIIKYLINKHKDIYDKYPKALAETQRNIGTLYMLAGNTKQARLYFIDAIQKNPYRSRSYLNLVFSLLETNLYSLIVNIKGNFQNFFNKFFRSRRFKKLDK